jgi:hypothetical protein
MQADTSDTATGDPPERHHFIADHRKRTRVDAVVDAPFVEGGIVVVTEWRR